MTSPGLGATMDIVAECFPGPLGESRTICALCCACAAEGGSGEAEPPMGVSGVPSASARLSAQAGQKTSGTLSTSGASHSAHVCESAILAHLMFACDGVLRENPGEVAHQVLRIDRKYAISASNSAGFAT